jgi:predicted acylesterase/phospholipase RssA
LERRIVRLQVESPDPEAGELVDALRYALSFARLTTVRNRDGEDVELMGVLGPHARFVEETLSRRVEKNARTVWPAIRQLPEVLERTRRMRSTVLENFPMDRDSLEAEVTTRLLAVASGGGGGAGYVYPGAYEMLERGGLIPDLMAGTSIGALMSLFRCRIRRWDFAPWVGAARSLTWAGVFKVLQSENRYGLPATLRLYLRGAIGHFFRHEDHGFMRMSDMEIPLHVVATGLTVDALKHDLDFYEHLLDEEVAKRGIRGGVKGGLKAIAMLREFMSKPDALVEVVLGREEGTLDFDAMDAAGFSAAIPGVIHYDVLRDDPRMTRILDDLYGLRGITRLGEGGMVSNVPARIAWESVMAGTYGRRNVFVLALDCFAPQPRRLPWVPIQQAVRAATVMADRKFADLYVTFPQTLSPMNLVPATRDALAAVSWGRERMAPYMPFVKEMTRPLPVLSDAPRSRERPT